MRVLDFGIDSTTETTHRMHITTSKTERAKRAEKFRDACEDIEELSILFAPNPLAFGDDGDKTRKRANLFAETVSFDPSGEERIEWKAVRRHNGIAALSAHFAAGMNGSVASLGHLDIRAVSIGYEESDFVSYFSLDLDGAYPITAIGPALAKALGRDRLVCHSGSGRAGRYRVFGRLASPMTVSRLKTILTAVCTRLGFPPVDGGLEIYPSYRHSRLPLGMGGCRMFDIETGRSLGEPNQADLARAMLSIEPVDLEAEAERFGISSNPGIDTGIPPKRGQFDPETRRERRRPTPRHIRRLIIRGVTRPGERQRIVHAFVYDCLLSGHSMNAAIDKLRAYIDEGKLDESFDVKRYGREWVSKQAPRIVKGIYARSRPVGMPDPIRLDGAELHRIRKIAAKVAAENPEFTEGKTERFLSKMLPIFKGCLAAGLPVARIHSKIWQAAGGTHYALLRRACGIFDARSGYKSMGLVMSRAHLGAQPCEAYAISWSTSFAFDRDLPAPSYEIARSILASSNEPDPSTSIPSPLPSIDPISSLPMVVSVLPRSPKGSSRLYVHHLQDPLQNKGSDETVRVTILSPNESDPVRMNVDIDYETIETKLNDEIAGAERRREELRRKRSEARFGPAPAVVVPEWKRVAKWALPGSEGMEIDAWLLADDEIHREYARELSEAKADRKRLFDQHGIRVSIGRVASKRFHELRALFGLDPWN